MRGAARRYVWYCNANRGRSLENGDCLNLPNSPGLLRILNEIAGLEFLRCTQELLRTPKLNKNRGPLVGDDTRIAEVIISIVSAMETTGKADPE
jgi:hypothetical protein